MKKLLDLIRELYGSKAIASTIGTKTNVVRLPSGKLQKYISKDLNIEAASDAAAQNAYNEMKELIPEVVKMNDAERLIFEGNLRRLKNRVQPEKQTAEVIGLESKQPIKGEGLTSLIKEAGQTSPPGTLMGDLESRINKLKALSKEEGLTMKDILGDFAQSQKGIARLQDEGLVRATARQILINDIKAGKIKNMTVEEAINIKEPIEPFRTLYGENALEQLDSLIPELRSLKTEAEAEKLARSKFEFEPKLNRPKESYTEEEMKKILEKKPKDKSRQLTREEIENYEEAIGRNSEEWLFEGTVDEAEKALKRSEDEYAYYSNLYKKGKLNPAPGEQTEDRMKFLQKKLQEASDVKDKRLISPDELKELKILEDTFLPGSERRTTPKEPVKNENQTKILNDFDITDREPNKKGGSAGLDYLMGF